MDNMKIRMQNGELIRGTMLSELSTPNIVRMMKTAGFDFVIVDCEHGYFDFSQVAAIASVANGFGITMLVRISSINKDNIAKLLDMGVDGLLVPMVNTVEEARRVVSLVKYPPMGGRGISTTRAHTNYNPPPLDQYVEQANRRTIILAQIESREGVGNSAKIATVEGIDALMVGPNDMAVDFGHPGMLETSEMTSAIEKIVESARNAGKPSGIIDSHIPFLQKWRAKHMSVFSCSSEVGMIMSTAKQIIANFPGNE